MRAEDGGPPPRRSTDGGTHERQSRIGDGMKSSAVETPTTFIGNGCGTTTFSATQRKIEQEIDRRKLDLEQDRIVQDTADLARTSLAIPKITASIDDIRFSRVPRRHSIPPRRASVAVNRLSIAVKPCRRLPTSEVRVRTRAPRRACPPGYEPSVRRQRNPGIKTNFFVLIRRFAGLRRLVPA